MENINRFSLKKKSKNNKGNHNLGKSMSKWKWLGKEKVLSYTSVIIQMLILYNFINIMTKHLRNWISQEKFI